MRIVVTGAGGFIGSHLVEALLADGHDVVGVEGFTAYYDPDRKRTNLATALESPRFEVVEGDLAELDLIAILQGADVVHHLAGQPGVRVSWGEGFASYLTQNVLTTQRLLEAAREVRLPRFVLASSSSIYGQAERFPTKETDDPRPVSPYGMTKLAAEQLCRVYGSQFDVPWVVLRYFSIFGPRQRPDMAFSRFIDALAAGQTLTVNGDGGQSRDFTYVGDAVAATVAAGERGTVGGVYNVAGGCQATVMEVIETLASLTGHAPQLDHVPPVAGDPRRTGADITRARDELGYVPAVGLEEGLSRQVEAQRAVGVRR